MNNAKPYIYWTEVGDTRALVVGPIALPGIALVVGTLLLFGTIMGGGFLFGPEVGTVIFVSTASLILLIVVGIIMKLVMGMVVEDYRKVNGMGEK